MDQEAVEGVMGGTNDGSISTHCTGLVSLNLYGCRQITDSSIISISTHCTKLRHLPIYDCPLVVTDAIYSYWMQYSNLDNDCNDVTNT